MMKLGNLAFVGALLAVMLSTAAAQEQPETDRLRQALSQAITQARSLEDQRTALQSQLAAAQRDKTALQGQVKAAKDEVVQVHKEYREAINEFNKRLAERDDTLEKWKAAYEEAATVARTKDQERAKFESEASAYKASTKSCTTKNTMLVKAGGELLQRYKSVTIGDAVVDQEPLLGLRRVEIQSQIQETSDKILDQKVQQ
jgi:chromosome segregation ATPase